MTLVVGGTVVLVARRSDRGDSRRRLVNHTRSEREKMKIRIKMRRGRRGGKHIRPVDRERLQRLYQAQMQQPPSGPRETYDDLIAAWK